jgi:chemotaxis protein MotB
MADLEVAPPRPRVIIRRKRADHGVQHGGAWKVAYADFVTALMALFIVLWLMSADKETQEDIAAYFNNPTGPGRMTGTAAAGLGHAMVVPQQDMNNLGQKIRQALLTVPNFRSLKDHVEITVTSDGLRIELMESDAGTFFQSGKAEPTSVGAALLSRLAEELSKLPNTILIEGHTDAKPFGNSGAFTNWELSLERAASARRLMEASGVRPEQIGQLRGYADRQLRYPDKPENAANRRISVIVQYMRTDSKAKDGKRE